MKPRKVFRFFSWTTALLLVCPLAARAQIHLERNVVGSGAGSAAGTGFQMQSTVGQPAIGLLGNANIAGEIGFWLSLQDVTAVPSGPGAARPSGVTLAIVGPNPAVGSAELRFGLPSGFRVTIRLYDVAGREVRNLADAEYGAGWHELRIDSRGLPSGVYLCRLTAGGFTASRRLILAK